MKTCVVTEPSFVGHLEVAKSRTITRNCHILLGNDFTLFGKDPKQLIGDPDSALSDFVCDMLFEAGMLDRYPVLLADGTQVTMRDGTKLWEYSWTDMPFSALSVPVLEAVAWDLRTCSNFAMCTIIHEAEHVGIDNEQEVDEGDAEEDDTWDGSHG